VSETRNPVGPAAVDIAGTGPVGQVLPLPVVTVHEMIGLLRRIYRLRTLGHRMSHTQWTPAKVSGSATDDEVETWGTAADDNVRTWGMAPAHEAAMPAGEEGVSLSAAVRGSRMAEAPPEHATPVQDSAATAKEAGSDHGTAARAIDVSPEAVAATQQPAGENCPAVPDGSAVMAAAQPAEESAEGPAEEFAEESAEETEVVGGSGGLEPQGSPAGTGTWPGDAPTGTTSVPDAGSPATQPLSPVRPVPFVPAQHGWDEEVSLADELLTADEDEPVAAEALAFPAPLAEVHPPAVPAVPAVPVEFASLPKEPFAPVIQTGAAQETDSVETTESARRHGKALVAAASTGALLIGIPLLLLGRGHEGEKPSAAPLSTAVAPVSTADAGVDNVVTDAPSPPATGRHRGPAAKNEKQPTAAVSPSALLQPRTTAKHAAKSSPTQGIPVRSTPKKSGGGETPTGGSTDLNAPATTVVIQATRTLSAGQSWSATLARMTMRSDGDLVISDEHGQVRWESHTSGAGNYAVFQGDGNLVVYNAAGQSLWTSGSAGHNGAELVLQADGNVVISQNGTAFWTSRTEH